jgi:hypothetical protein
MIALLREFLSGFAERGAARTLLGVEAPRLVGIPGQLARDAGPALALPLVTGGSAFAFCPRDGGTEELSGVFEGPPTFASSSAMRALCAFTSTSNS